MVHTEAVKGQMLKANRDIETVTSLLEAASKDLQLTYTTYVGTWVHIPPDNAQVDTWAHVAPENAHMQVHGPRLCQKVLQQARLRPCSTGNICINVIFLHLHESICLHEVHIDRGVECIGTYLVASYQHGYRSNGPRGESQSNMLCWRHGLD